MNRALFILQIAKRIKQITSRIERRQGSSVTRLRLLGYTLGFDEQAGSRSTAKTQNEAGECTENKK
jgi:hypothetical protein